MTSAASRLPRIIAAAAVALAAPAAAEPVRVVSGEVFVKLPAGASNSGEQIDVESFSWGETQSAYKLDRAFVKSWSTSGDANAPGEWIAEVERPAATARRGTGANTMAMDDTPGKEKARRGTRTVDANEKITIHGARTESRQTTSGKASSDMVMKGSKIGQNRTAGGDPDRPIVIGTVPNPPRAPMQYNPTELSVSKTNNRGAARATPAAKGSVWIRVSTPWAGCRVGAHYPSLELGGGAGRTYRLQDVTVASCGAAGSPDEVAFSYQAIKLQY